ncbi:MAG: ubiquinone/menaquinone biosynthesis C-methylase UbiE [Paracoccaceae bacterium]|jgi:ubiquinone/menaquinone biosynthesis C-methylase UbiE
MPARASLNLSSMDRYWAAASIYDLATLAWSGGAIWRTRAHALAHAKPGATVLIPGAGSGRLALEAAELGATVLALDHSKAMLARARRRVDRHRARPGGGALDLDLRFQSLEDLEAPDGFDLVVAEHFLNVFRPEAMPAIRERLIQLTKPGGAFVIADFTPLRQDRAAPLRAAQALHHVIPLGGCALLTKNAMHPIYDHGRDLESRQDLRLESCVDEPSFRIGPRWFRAWTFRKLAPSP